MPGVIRSNWYCRGRLPDARRHQVKLVLSWPLARCLVSSGQTGTVVAACQMPGVIRSVLQLVTVVLVYDDLVKKKKKRKEKKVSLICNVSLSGTARTIVYVDPFLRYTLHVAETYGNSENQTNTHGEGNTYSNCRDVNPLNTPGGSSVILFPYNTPATQPQSSSGESYSSTYSQQSTCHHPRCDHWIAIEIVLNALRTTTNLVSWIMLLGFLRQQYDEKLTLCEGRVRAVFTKDLYGKTAAKATWKQYVSYRL